MGVMLEEGFSLAHDPREAHVIIVNTCAFIKDAVEEAIETILEMAEKKGPGAKLVVAGCLPQRYGMEVAREMPEVDLWVSPGELLSIPRLVGEGQKGLFLSGSKGFLYDSSMPRVLFNNPYVAYVKIADGCLHRCSFCTIPKIRGKFRSRSREDIVREVRGLAERGVQEIVLVAQDTTSYGRDLGKVQLLELVEDLLGVPGYRWLRIMYCYPDPRLFPRELLELIANEERMAPYLDLPFQHISDKVLKAMRRTTGKADLLELFDTLGAYPRIALRGTAIVGFPGEGDQEFLELYEFVSQGIFTHLGLFKYSPEEETPAAAYPDQVPDEVKEERFAAIMEAQQKISLAKNRALLGSTVPVLVEGVTQGGLGVGRTPFQAPEVDGLTLIRGRFEPGRVLEGRVVEAGPYDLLVEASS